MQAPLMQTKKGRESGPSSCSTGKAQFAVAVAVAVARDLALPGSLPQRRSRRTRPRRGDVHGFGGKRRSTASPRRTGRRRAATAPDSTAKRASTSFFDTAGMSCRKIPAAGWTRRAQRVGRGGRACFLLATFSLHEQRKVARSREAGAKAFALSINQAFGLHRPSPQPPLRAPAHASGVGAPRHARQWRANRAFSPRRESPPSPFRAPVHGIAHRPSRR